MLRVAYLLLQPRLIFSEITLLAGNSPGNLATLPPLALLFHASHLVHPSLTENSIIGDEVVTVIAYDPVKCPSSKIIQRAALAGSETPIFTAI